MSAKNIQITPDGFVWLVVTEKSKEIFHSGLFALYILHEDNSESLVNDIGELNTALEFGLSIGIEVGHLPKEKLSVKLMAEANAEENDLKFMGIATKAMRENRIENFEENWLKALEEKFETVELRKNGSYTFTAPKFGIIDFFPRANKVLIREKNKWQKPGLKWIINTLLK